jgi:uncharacterized protein YeaO (DUF488 family)
MSKSNVSTMSRRLMTGSGYSSTVCGQGASRKSAPLWMKEVAPSSELRTWFGHRPDRFADFAARYVAELNDNPAVAQLVKLVAQNPTVTLLYGAKDKTVNHAVVLAEYLAR